MYPAQWLKPGHLIEDLCDRLRDSTANQPLYIERAETD